MLVLAAAGLRHEDNGVLDRVPDASAVRRLQAFMRERIERRVPAPYIIGEAWFAGLRFRIDSQVLIPRSPFAELLGQRFEPWLRPGPVTRILEVGTGSGCIAIAAALAFPESTVLATDISSAALAIAGQNRDLHQLRPRVHLVRADLLAGLRGPFDLIISNPPYVPEAEMAELPPEYGHEPLLALVSGADGMDSPRRILQDAARLLTADGLLALEVGAGWSALERAFPRLPITWPELEMGGEGIGLVAARDLRAVDAAQLT